MPPIKAMIRLSTSNCRTMRQRLAPNAVRKAISFCRPVARANIRLATLAQAISRTPAAIAISTHNGRVSALREKKKAEYEAAGAKLTFTAFIAKVVIDALRQFPIVNASVDGDSVAYHKEINVGIAVALDWGLIVPVIKNADEKNLVGLSRAIEDLAARARSKKLNPDEVQGGTFTITNPGIFGAVYGLPLINQPQVAILGVGVIEKRAVVVNDAIAIHPTCHLSLGYDHRLIDGADAGRFLSYMKERLEKFDEAWM